MKGILLLLLVTLGLLSACAAPATQAPTSQPTEALSSTNEAPTTAPAATETSAPAVESSPTGAQAAAGAAVSFASDILPILESRCVNCHGADRTEAELSVKTYVELMSGSKDGAVVVPGDAQHSKLAELILNQKMPKRGPKLTPPQVQLIIDWINQGALNN